MNRLLALTEWLCGERLCRSTFEPLLADWQRELDEARREGRWQVAAAAVSGAAAFARTLVRCMMFNDGWLPGPRASMVAALTFVIALKAAFIILWVLSLPSGMTTDIGAIRTQSFLLSFAGLAAALVLLPVVFIMRGDPRSTPRHALTVIAVGAALTAGIATLTSPEALNRYFTTPEWFEREYQRSLANDRAGRVTYPGTAVREVQRLTFEQRRARYDRYMAWRAEQEAKQPPVTWLQRVQQLRPVALAVLFGVMGWTLAGLGPATLGRAAGWWALMFVATLSFGSMPGTLTGIGMPILPHSYALPLFGAITLALVVARWRQASAPTAPQAPQAP
jgi:hypothetical protein